MADDTFNLKDRELLLTAEEAERARLAGEMRGKYHALFSLPMGRDVLIDILRMCKWGEQIPESDNFAVAAHNVGTAILIKCGFYSEGVEGLVKTILGAAITPPRP